MFMSTNNTNNTNYRSLKATLPKLDDYDFDDYDLADILEREEQLDSSGQIGDYDDLGYGIALPIKYVQEIIKYKKNKLDVSPNFFIDYKD